MSVNHCDKVRKVLDICQIKSIAIVSGVDESDFRYARDRCIFNITGVIIITVLFYFIGTAVFSIDPCGFPERVQNICVHQSMYI